MDAIELGDYVKDTVSGFFGRVTIIVDYLGGRRAIGVMQTQLGLDGKPLEVVFDAGRLAKYPGAAGTVEMKEPDSAGV